MNRLSLAVACSAFALSGAAFAQVADDGTDLRPSIGEHRTLSTTEFGVGLLTLPNAEVCVQRPLECAEGDTSLELTGWQMFRVTPTWAVGAGVGVALTPTEPPRDDPVGLPRTHSRRYFTMEPGVRYYLIAEPRWELWGGATTGLVVVSDSIQTNRGQSDRALVGPSGGVTIRTEGWTLAGAVGAAYVLTPHLAVGLHVRYGGWFLPKRPKTNPLGDEASLTGRNGMFDFGLTGIVRMPI